MIKNSLNKKVIQTIPEGDNEGRYTQEVRLSLLNARLDLKNGMG